MSTPEYAVDKELDLEQMAPRRELRSQSSGKEQTVAIELKHVARAVAVVAT